MIPTGALEHDDSGEFARVWLGGGMAHVSLNIGGMGDDADQEARQWGWILADIAAHVVRGMQQNEIDAKNSDVILALIEQGFKEQLSEGSAITGSLVQPQ